MTIRTRPATPEYREGWDRIDWSGNHQCEEDPKPERTICPLHALYFVRGCVACEREKEWRDIMGAVGLSTGELRPV